MANLIRRALGARSETRYSIDQYIDEYLLPSQFVFGGNVYGGVPGLRTTYDNRPIEKIADTLPGYSAILRGCPPAFAAEMVRALVVSQARLTFRSLPGTPNARKLFGTTALAPLERPWRNGTTGDLLARMEWHAGLAGNAYVTFAQGQGQGLRVLRPDWTGILYGSQLEPDDPGLALDAEVIAYIYQQGGISPTNKHRVYQLMPQDVAHYAPLPDPECAGLGMSWITPAVREIQGDKAATDHKLQFFRNGATPNLVVKNLPNFDRKADFDALVDMMEGRHAGVANAYRTLYLSGGADATVIGSDLRQIDFKATQGAGETRISVLSRVPAVVLGISEGLQGSSLTTGNFGQARRLFADTWLYSALQGMAASLAPLVTVPPLAELWPDIADIPLLREDAKDEADINAAKASTLRTLIEAGIDPDTAIAAAWPEQIGQLKHTGLVSVQLQEPGTNPPPDPSQNGNAPAMDGNQPAMGAA